MKKENKQKKRDQEREQERQEADRRFKRQGNICLAVVAGSFVLMLVVGHALPEAPWLNGFFIAMGLVIAAAFLYSLRNVTLRLRQMRNEEENQR